MLAELMRLKQGIAIAGTHGKTTTTCLVTSVLAEAGLDPTFVIGGRLNAPAPTRASARATTSSSRPTSRDASFLNLMPVMAVVTNIDADHMETYGHDFARLKQAFVEFLHRMPFYGAAILCGDDAGVRSIVPMISRPVVSYGFGADAHGARRRRARRCRRPDALHRAAPQRRARCPTWQVTLNLPGEHNVLNALAAIAVATELELPDAPVVKALAEFNGVGRRFQRYGEQPARDGGGSFTLIDDYGHHPVEMAATLAAARGAFPGRRLVLAFQPHRYTRTRDCFEDFVKVLGRPTRCCWPRSTPPARRRSSPPTAARWRARCAWPARSTRCSSTRSARWPQAIVEQARDGDVVIAMGAGLDRQRAGAGGRAAGTEAATT